MKQIQKTAEILAKLRKAVGDDAALDDLAVYEAIAFNTMPIRKRHPLYKGARADRAMLVEMANALEAESRPVHIMHNGETLPVGRVFTGEVLDGLSGSELRVLFYVDKQNEEIVRSLDLGITDQVSVSVLSKKLLCSDCGFDFFGPKADVKHLWTATCDDGHTLGEGHTHGKLVGLDDWFELSLVNRGGAQNARIVSRDKSHFGSPTAQRLAASGMDPNSMILSAIAASQEKTMDFEKLAAELVDLRVENKTLKPELDALKASVAAKDAEIADLSTKLKDAGDAVAALAAKDEEITALKAGAEATKADADAAIAALKDVAKALLVAGGDVNPTLPETVAELSALIEEKKTALAAALVVGGKSQPAKADKPTAVPSVSPFRTR